MRCHFGRRRDRPCLALCCFGLSGFSRCGFDRCGLDRCSRLLRTLEVRTWCRAVFTGVGFGCRGSIAHAGVVVLTGFAVLACFAIAFAAVAAITVA